MTADIIEQAEAKLADPLTVIGFRELTRGLVAALKAERTENERLRIELHRRLCDD